MTTANEIKGWFEEAKRTKCEYLIVACDTFDHEDYPIFCKDAAECWREYGNHNGVNMQRIMEVYRIADGWQSQSTGRVMNLPQK